MDQSIDFSINKTLAVAMKEYYMSSFQQLISNEAFNAIRRIGSQFPIGLSSFWGYEIPLSLDERTFDLLFCVHNPVCMKKAFLIAHNAEADDCLLIHPLYNYLKDFSLQWADEKKKLRRLITNIWFEYDAADLMRAVPLPNFFFAPKRSAHPLEIVHISNLVFENILQKHIIKGVYPLLLTCIRMLESKGWISQIGVMLARNEQGFRLFIQDIPSHGILPYLKKIGYKHAGDPDLIHQLNCCYLYCKRVELDIDISDEVAPKIGLECYFSSTEQVLLFLDWLHQNGMCHDNKFRNLKNHLSNIKFDKSNEFQHFFSHLKLNYVPGAGFTSKAYIGYADSSVASQVIRTKPLKMHEYE